MITKIKTFKLISESFSSDTKKFNNEDFTAILEIANFVAEWYKGYITSSELADGIRYAVNKYRHTYPFDEVIGDILDYADTIEAMEEPDDINGSGSVWNYFADIDVEDFMEDPEYDELETEINNIRNSIRQKDR